MKKCKYINCDKDVTGRQVYCSDKCRKAQSRTGKSDKPKLGQGVTPSGLSSEPPVYVEAKKIMKQAKAIAKPKAQDPSVQAIWDGRNAQGQAAGYDNQAQPEDYPQTQRPIR